MEIEIATVRPDGSRLSFLVDAQPFTDDGKEGALANCPEAQTKEKIQFLTCREKGERLIIGVGWKIAEGRMEYELLDAEHSHIQRFFN